MVKYSELPKDKNGYPYYKKDGKKIWVHRRVAEKKYGKIPKDFVVHHIDKNKINNFRSNLIILHKKDHNRLHKRKTLTIKNKKK